MAIIGYARISTTGQTLEGQLSALRAAGADRIVEETGSGGNRQRPALAQLLKRIGEGDVLLVVRIDRLARSVAHLLEVIETLERRGAGFRSLGDPVDTTTPQGKFTLQILGAVAELERALIRERTLAGLDVARKAGRVGGNPKLRDRDPDALKALARSRDTRFFEEIAARGEEWVPHVRRLRPGTAWPAVAEAINRQRPAPQTPWTAERVKRATRRFVRDGLLEDSLLDRAPKAQPSDRLCAIVAGMVNADPSITLARIGAGLERLHERTPSGKQSWSLSSVKMLRDRARRLGLIPA
ncbi:recombinase family protein [Pseudooceanicola nanhaiensis]|uniref:recombinase family protein n=1 Tax=Pseudooceanicola nanhaiensis TaxID=375761 RepID=UPI001CD6486D|nr:recombinase family protein [Pseudooceanicola nanhaiensis]MCA0922598.1 recombinase family protein [Pseudooceanicola nanhaiensis]